MDSDSTLRLDLAVDRGFNPQARDAAETSTSAVGIAADEGETQEEAGDAEHDEGGADEADEEEGEGEADQ